MPINLRPDSDGDGGSEDPTAPLKGTAWRVDVAWRRACGGVDVEAHA
ncbi:hypothetical protein ES332_D07G130500v1 [Gossypium tomentosum]|uniref:Uncharacterized protein n=1 Tax=Gossypium tomentosum TaxID=34277 RepID=A0A5D2K6S6_GOSTO|nr:hypothetical protein ES332_D07G130500v1 [Gossypium tomentosum]